MKGSMSPTAGMKSGEQGGDRVRGGRRERANRAERGRYTGNEGFEPCLEVDLLRLVAQDVLEQVLDFAAHIKVRIV